VKEPPVPIRVFLVDDHEVVRRGVRDLLETYDDIRVVGEAATAEEAVGRILAVSPDVAVLDIRLPDGDGVAVCREVRSRRPELKVLMLTSVDDDEALFDAILAGASGYVLKQIRSGELVEDIRRVAAGQSLLDPAVTGAVLQRIRDRREPAHHDGAALTEQEQRILALVAEGRTHRQIGDQLYLAEKTVKHYVSTILHKLGMKRRTEAAVYVVRQAEGRVPDYARH
jgi:DNA-binding NarL/FixJ family response regulator